MKVSVFPKIFLPRIFDPYFTTKQLGSGLGLATTYSIISHHKGQIAVHSEPEDGTEFIVYLPAVPNANVRNGTVENAAQTGQGKILIMDDEEPILNLMSQMLSYLGYSSVGARDGEEAIRIFRGALEEEDPFDAVILDLTVPGGPGGKEVVEDLHRLDTELKAIVSSGYSNDPIMGEYKKYGFCGCVSKPFSLKELSSILQRALHIPGGSVKAVDNHKSSD